MIGFSRKCEAAGLPCLLVFAKADTLRPMQRLPHPSGVITYTFDFLADYPAAAHVSTRHGGVSPAPFDTLNFSITRGDAPQNVEQNRPRLYAALGLDINHGVSTHQVHGTGVAKVDWADAGTRQAAPDGLITDAVGLPLALVFADCVPLVLYDPVQHALGACHAGWRGTVNGTATATLWGMQAAYGTQPAEVRVGIGPSIGPASYEVGDEVVEMAQVRLKRAERFFRYPNGEQARPYFDLWAANAAQLVDAGVVEEHIEISAIDTAQNTQDFFSHRAERGQCGLFAMVAWLESRESSADERR